MSRASLPHRWEKVTLGEITENVMYGLNAKAIDFDGKKKYIRITDIDDNNKFSPDPLTSPDRSAGERYKLVKGDLLFARTGATVGKSYLYDKSDGDVYFAGFLIRFHIVNANPKFIFFQTQTHSYGNWVKSVSMRSGQPGINAEEYKKLPLVLPPLDIQKSVVEFIEQWDTAIEKTEALIDAKERQLGWLIAKLIGEQTSHLSRLGDYFGSSITVEKGKTITKAEIAENGDIPVIAGGTTSPYSHDQSTHSIPCITVSTSGAAGYVWYHDYPIWASDCLVIYSTDHSTEYLYFALKSKQSKIYALQSGGAQPHVYVRDLKNIAIPLPTLEEQKRIAEILSTARQEINLLKELTHRYRKQKRGLMQKLLSGTWHIRHINNKEDT